MAVCSGLRIDRVPGIGSLSLARNRMSYGDVSSSVANASKILSRRPLIVNRTFGGKFEDSADSERPRRNR
jgi:hypothetical protein